MIFQSTPDGLGDLLIEDSGSIVSKTSRAKYSVVYQVTNKLIPL